MVPLARLRKRKEKNGNEIFERQLVSERNFFPRVLLGHVWFEERGEQEKKWNGGEGRRKEWRRILKLNFIFCFDIKFDKKSNYNFFFGQIYPSS